MSKNQTSASPARVASTPDKLPSREHFQDVVTLVIGLKKKSYTLHKDLLCFYSDYFRAAFNRSFKEATKRKIELEDVEEEVFEHFQVWLYTRQLPKVPDNEHAALTYERFIDLWIFGDRHQIPLLQNYLMDAIFSKYKETRLFAAHSIGTIYKNTVAESPLRKAAVDIISTINMGDGEKTLWISNFQGYCTVEILKDILKEVYAARQSKLPIGKLPKRDKCYFHVHGRDEHC